MLSDRKWLKWLKCKIEEYEKEYETYESYADFIKTIMGIACKRIAPFAIVEARAKSKASYAKKLVIKKLKFLDPDYQITDRCGVRVITQTSQEKELICDYIRRNFEIDTKNSIDVRSRLKEDEFGYLSVHYIVQLKETDSQLEGISVPRRLGKGASGHKAEIQVRTLLEHAWANILHDRMYKSQIQVPTALKREAAALAATMEEADGGFSRLAETVDSYFGSYSAYYGKEKMAEERAVLKTLQAALKSEGDEPDKADIALRLGRLACISGNLKEAIVNLERYKDNATPSRDAIRMELGRALCKLHQSNTKNPEFSKGQKLLRSVIERKPDPREPILPLDQTLRAEAAHALALSFSWMHEREPDARGWYSRAYELDPCNPYHLTAFIEYEVFCRGDRSFVDVMRRAIEEAVATCQSHLVVCIEMPRAHFTIGRLYLLAGEHASAFNAYARAIGVVLAPESTVPLAALDEEIAFLRHINPAKDLPPEHDRVRQLLLLARALRSPNPKKAAAAFAPKSDGAAYILALRKETVLMIAGGASKMEEESARDYADLIEKALSECDGLVCSGATTAGIPGIVGEISERLKKKGRKRFTLMGYISRNLPHDAQADRRRYDRIIPTDGTTLTELEPLQNWIDLIRAGFRPNQVRVLGVNGGDIAAFEYRLALALGAKVGIVLYSGRAADAILDDPYWHDHPNLIRLPRGILDVATIRAFVRPASMDIRAKKLEELAEIIHKKYLSENQYSDVDPSRRKYRDLREDFKESNRQQALYIAEILATEGYKVEPFTKKGKPPIREFAPKEIERMAELEHGRWNIERLSAGWQHGPKKNAEKKLNPCLIPWRDLPDGDNGVKKYDRSAVIDFPKVLAKAGFKIVKAS
jgi:ppGpp synthetase/RelA/SpoT-type nucleotidyltranferase